MTALPQIDASVKDVGHPTVRAVLDTSPLASSSSVTFVTEVSFTYQHIQNSRCCGSAPTPRSEAVARFKVESYMYCCGKLNLDWLTETAWPVVAYPENGYVKQVFSSQLAGV